MTLTYQKIIFLPLLVFGFLSIAFFAHAAPAFDAASFGSTASATSFTFSQTVGSGNGRALLIFVNVSQPSAVTVSSVTYDSGGSNPVPLTFVSGITIVDSVRMELWRLTAPASGAHTIRVVLSASAAARGSAVSYSGVDQITPLSNTQTASGNSTLALVSMTSNASALVVAGAGNTSSFAFSASGGQTTRVNNFASMSAIVSDKPGALPVSMGYTLSRNNWTIIGTSLNSDITAPVAVSNLSASSPTALSMLLFWTAPGDDGSVGTATSYDIRYSTANITDANWASATQVSSEPAPLAAGNPQSMTVSGLSANTTYYFAMKTSDEVPNISLLSNIASGATLPPPPPVVTTNTAIGITSSSAMLQGSANPNGAATTGWFRYSATSPGSCNDSFGTRDPLSGGASLGSGSASVAYSNSASSLTSGTTYYYCAIASNAGGPAFGAVVSFFVPLPAAPTFTTPLSANPASVVSGYATTLTWVSSGADSCSASAIPANGLWTGSKALSGSQSTGALTQTTAFTLTCTNVGGSTPSSATVSVTPPPNVSGYAWAGSGEGATDAAIKANPGIGWISMSCANTGVCGTSNYGVSVSSANPGVLSGYAWANPNDGAQNNIGWISFNQAELTSCPSGTCIAQLDRSTGQVSGWARACVVFASGCSGALRPSSDLGGWDGWIHLSGTGYGVTVLTCAWSGYAWGGGGIPGSNSPIGWIHFGGALYSVTGTGDGCASSGSISVSAMSNSLAWPSSGTASVNYSISGPTAIASANSVPITYSNLLSGSYSLTYSSGGPVGGTLASISPCAAGINPCSQSIPGGGGPISFTLNFNTPPSSPAPVSMAVAPQNSCKVVNVSWGSSAGATGYNAQRCTDASCSLVPIPACSALAPATSCTDITAPDGIPLWYRVNAYNGFGTSAWAYSVSSITNNAPDVSFSYTPSLNIAINQLVKFAGVLIGGGATTSQSWTFAGGTPASSVIPSPSASFSTAGSHAVSYTANNGSGSCLVSGSVSVSQNTFGDWCELPPDAPPGTPCP